MATATHDAPIKRVYGETIAIPGSASAKTVVLRRHGWNELIFYGDRAFRLNFGPVIREIWFYNASAAAGSRWETLTGNFLTDRHVDGNTATTLDAMTASDYLYVCTEDEHGGLYVDMNSTSVNDQASVLTMAYGKSDATWAAQAITDGTISPAGTTLGQDGLITLDAIPTDWLPQTLGDLGITDADRPGKKGYWVRFDVSDTLGTDTDIAQLAALSPIATGGTDTAGYWPANTLVTVGFQGEVGSIEFLSQDTTAGNIYLDWVKK